MPQEMTQNMDLDIKEIKPANYCPRIIDAQISKYLSLFGAIEVSGTKWCGKTWSSLMQAKSSIFIDHGSNYQISKTDPSYALAGKKPHVIDEWQRVPAIWDTVRHAVDKSFAEHGKWILTGSSAPDRSSIAHSGAGRIARIKMHPMTLEETGESNACVSLSGLFGGDFTSCQCSDGIDGILNPSVRGGWPALMKANVNDAQIVIREYLESIFLQRGFQERGSGDILRNLSKSLARNLGTSAKINTLARDVFNLENNDIVTEQQRKTIANHLSFLSQIYFVDEIRGWLPSSRSPKRMRQKPKRYFADPSLPVSLLGLSADALLQDWQTFGLVFENLVMRDLIVYAQAVELSSNSPVYYYYDDSGLEVDAIIELSDGRWGAIEIKVSLEKVDVAAHNLIRMKNKVCANKKACVKEPSFLAVVTGMGQVAYQRSDGVYVIPIRALGA